MAFDKNVFIFGAGASAGAGAPVLKDFLKRARELYDNRNSGLSGDEREAFGSVFKWRGGIYPALRVLKIDLDNVEDLFSLVDMAWQPGDQEAGHIVHSLIKMVSRTLELVVKFRFDPVQLIQSGGDFDKHVSNDWAYRGFLEVLENWIGHRDAAATERDSFITLNYDTIFDRTLRSLGRGFTYCHPDWLSGMDPESHKLLKLHGSVNWGKCPECGYKMAEMDFFGRGRNVPGSEFITMCAAAKLYQTDCPECAKKGLTVNLRPFAVPPTWNKASYSADLTPVWQAAREELAKAARLIIVGYSLPRTDSFFKYLLALGLSKNESLQEIILIDPAGGDAGESLKNRYLDFIAPFFDTNNFTFWSVPFVAGSKALEYRFIEPRCSKEEALEMAIDFVERNIAASRSRPSR